MRAMRHVSYGPPNVLKYLEVDPPVPGPHDVLVRVRAASVNPLDDHHLRGTPYLRRTATGLLRPKGGLGADLAGRVESVGSAVTRFAPGDEVFGGRGASTDDRSAAFAQYACFPEDAVLLAKPPDLTFEEAAAVPVAGLTALQALRDAGRLQPGQHVLVNGAAGGVGTFAVQFAKAFGAHVTGVCGSGNVDLVRSLGADHVIDYTTADVTASGRYDLVLDMIGNRSPGEFRRVLAPRGTLVCVGQAVPRHLLLRPVLLRVTSAFIGERLVPFLIRNRREELAAVRDLLVRHAARPVVDRTYPLERAAEALAYFEQGHVRGKVVLRV
ncbi:NAD(P)-dependent alcohol dehydrogenase [Saccharothrix obliqua]|uniref:NAD(P)-dependent alcohol dehydrogenase n=1 Tax=Saccharothrix obliqua TaxID=2861747 RepID=UPI001C5E798A|nr:NAD(P)-dependent alcohol dehydrogenase [Saccharothrix obliqua]MBW4720089.1 NAD(P)-dependent alcohol dehydrogenase [Saccharothrix obliqua]